MNACTIGLTKKGAEALVCRLYSMHKTYSICTAWYMLFCKTCEPEEMSPTSDALHFHLIRVHNKAMLWRNVHCAIPVIADPPDSDVTESNYQNSLDVIS